MKIVVPFAEMVWITSNALGMIERAGRTAYKSEDKITGKSADKFVTMLLKRGHESVLEHASASIKVVCDRGVSHEFVRHRLFSFTQESTRYCDYVADKFDGEIAVIMPPNLTTSQRILWEQACEHAEQQYIALRKDSTAPQIARAVLPTCLKTEMVVTGNLRQWRTFLKLRLAEGVHPQMKSLAKDIAKLLDDCCPVVFEEFVTERD